MKITNPRFRPFTHADCESIARHANNINVWNNVRDYFPHPYTLADAGEFIAYCLSRSPQTDYAIDVDGQAVGVIGIVPRTDVQRISAEVGYWLGEDLWGKGIATKVLRDFTEYIFSTTGYVHLFATVFGTNHASMRVLEKAGFSFVGVMHKAAVKNGRMIDLHIYEKLKPDGVQLNIR